ncbi:MAG TPA: hypothetical protein VGU20_20785 [Stellaceae bacterium]|nr:hypothetical protein [Stellaceae bacterium]
MRRRKFIATIAVAALLPLAACASASVVSRRDVGSALAAGPPAYVAEPN